MSGYHLVPWGSEGDDTTGKHRAPPHFTVAKSGCRSLSPAGIFRCQRLPKHCPLPRKPKKSIRNVTPPASLLDYRPRQPGKGFSQALGFPLPVLFKRGLFFHFLPRDWEEGHQVTTTNLQRQRGMKRIPHSPLQMAQHALRITLRSAMGPPLHPPQHCPRWQTMLGVCLF